MMTTSPDSVEARFKWHVTVTTEGGMFVSQLHEIDITSQGSSPEQALSRLAMTISAERDFTTRRSGLAFVGIESGPPSSQDQTIAALRSALKDTTGRVEHASSMFHNSQQWHEEDAPDGSGTMWDWVFAPAFALSQESG